MTFLEKLTEPSRATLDVMRMAAIVRINDAIDQVRELRDESILPEEMPDRIQKLLTQLIFVKTELLFDRGENGKQSIVDGEPV